MSTRMLDTAVMIIVFVVIYAILTAPMQAMTDHRDDDRAQRSRDKE
jgi:hypothetical protein